MEEEMQKAVDKYSKALMNRIEAKKKLHRAQLADQKTRNELSSAREELRAMEQEMNEFIYSDGLIPSTLKVKKEHASETA